MKSVVAGGWMGLVCCLQISRQVTLMSLQDLALMHAVLRIPALNLALSPSKRVSVLNF